jgi:hypothetical protein
MKMIFSKMSKNGFVAMLVAIGATGFAQADEFEVQKDGVEEQVMDHKGKHKKMRKHMGEKVKQHMEQIDTNEDGKIDLNEYLTNAEQRFNDMDIDGDNYVTGKEARKHHKELRKEHMHARKKHHKERQKHREQAELDASKSEAAE